LKKIDKSNNDIRKEIQPISKALMDLVRQVIPPTDTEYLMTEGELTEEQLRCEKPIGTKGYYRMYRWECLECDKVGKKMPYYEMQTDAIKHYELTGHKMKEKGGVFEKKDMYTY
jgi:hypothetical protein